MNGLHRMNQFLVINVDFYKLVLKVVLDIWSMISVVMLTKKAEWRIKKDCNKSQKVTKSHKKSQNITKSHRKS